jgi:hypothetical protein
MTNRRCDPEDTAFEHALDGRSGEWTRLALMRMDARFCAAVKREHPDQIDPYAEAADPIPARARLVG